MSAASKTKKDIKKMSDSDLQKELRELREQLRSAVSSVVKSPVTPIRKQIARILTEINRRKREIKSN